MTVRQRNIIVAVAIVFVVGATTFYFSRTNSAAVSDAAFWVALVSGQFLLIFTVRNSRIFVKRAGRSPAVAQSEPKQSGVEEIVSNFAVFNLRESLMLWTTIEGRVHAETLLVAIGAIAGFAAQSAALARVRKADIPKPNKPVRSVQEFTDYLRESGLFLIATTKSGEKFYFGDLINGYLVPQATSTHPLSSFVDAAALAAGLKPSDIPDYREMFAHAARTVGSPEFAHLRVEQEHQPQIAVRQALDIFWPRAKFLLEKKDGPGPANGHNVAPEDWPRVTSTVANQLIAKTKDVLEPQIAVRLVMESAIAMSKIDPETVPQIWKDAPAAGAN